MEPETAPPWPDSAFPADPYPGARPAVSFVHVATAQADPAAQVPGAPHGLGPVRRPDEVCDDDGGSLPLHADRSAPSGWRLAGRCLDAWLADHGAAPMSGRVPVLAYGSNVCPSKIAWMRAERGLTGPVVVLRVRVEGLSAVWSAGLRLVDDQRPATLAAAPGTVETHAVWMVEPHQFAALDTVEGRDVDPPIYRLARVATGAVTVLDDGAPPAALDDGAPPAVLDGGAPPAVPGNDAPIGVLDDGTPAAVLDDGAPAAVLDGGAPAGVIDRPWAYLAPDEPTGNPRTDRRPLLVDGSAVPCTALDQAGSVALAGVPGPDGLDAATVDGVPAPQQWPPRVFVYGSLMPGQAAWPLLQEHAAPHRPPYPATLQHGTVADTGCGYPALTLDTAGAAAGGAPGHVVELSDPQAALPALDEYEGPQYRRIRVVVADGTVCWAWLWTASRAGLTPLARGWAAR